MEINGTAPASNPLHLQATLRPGDVLLVEGNTRLSGAIKYLTQSTWSHAALYVGNHFADHVPPDHCLVDADTVHGVRSTSLEKFSNLHTRICRPIGLSEQECAMVTMAAISQIGHQYDLRNVIDLARYLFPTPPVPTAHFSDRGHLFQADRGRRFRAIVDAQGMRASEGLNVSQSSKRSQATHREAACWIATSQTYPRRRAALATYRPTRWVSRLGH
jgi:hypothetical protein